MNTEKRFIITKQEGGTRYLMHEGHSHKWCKDRSLAMEYTRPDVAAALAHRYGGSVQEI